MGPVRQNPIQRTVRSTHRNVLLIVHSFSTQYCEVRMAKSRSCGHVTLAVTRGMSLQDPLTDGVLPALLSVSLLLLRSCQTFQRIKSVFHTIRVRCK